MKRLIRMWKARRYHVPFRVEEWYNYMAMQGICANHSWDKCTWDVIANDAYEAAHALVEKMKEERK